MALGYLISPVIQLEDASGKPLTGGYLKVCLAGTSDTYITYKDFDGDRNPAEVPLDAKGMCILIADDTKLYDIYCFNRLRAQQWSRLNVSVGQGGGGGGGTVTNITSSDGSIRVQQDGNDVDLTVASGSSSALCTYSEGRTTDGWFTFYEPTNSAGAGLYVDGGAVKGSKGWVHYDATVRVNWNGTVRNRLAQLGISGPDCNTEQLFDLSFQHTEWFLISSDHEISSDGGTLSFAISGIPEVAGFSAQITNLSVHTLVAEGGGFYTEGEGISIAPATGAISVEVPVPSPTPDDNGKVLGVVDASANLGWVTGGGGGGTVDQTYDPTSSNAQSGTAVAGAITNVRQVPTTVPEDDGKVLGVVDASGTLGWVANGVTYTPGNMIDMTGGEISVETTAGITDIQVVADLPLNPSNTVLYLIPE